MARLGSNSSPRALRRAASRSFNLLFRFQANLGPIAPHDNGSFDAGILQLLQLTAWGYLALLFYLIFEVCLYGLIHQIRGWPE